MINEIYVNDVLVITESPKKQFENGFKIKCTNCKEIIERKWFDNKILNSLYICKSCLLKNNNPMFNKDTKEKHNKIVQSDEYRKKMSKLLSGDKNPFYGKTHTKETTDKIVNKTKIWYQNLTDIDYINWTNKMSEGQKKYMIQNPIYYKKIKSKAARKSHESQFLNKKMNKIEKIVFDYLKPIIPELKFSINLASYQYDFGIKYRKILIETDGDYWHGNPKFYNENGNDGKRKLNEIQKNKMIQDKEKTEWAISRGFIIIRLWENEINNGLYKEKLNTIL